MKALALPSFSVVIPTYARLGPLKICLQSLAGLDYPRDRFEVVVVDDGSDRQPEELVASFHGRLDVTLLRQRHAGPAAARNTGATTAEGDYLAFTDDDCAPAPDWLKALAARCATVPEHGLGGQILNALPQNIFSTASQQLMAYLYGYYNHDPGNALFFASSNLALPAEGFRAVGGFDTSFPRAGGEDREFCDRWRRRGYRLTYAPEAIVSHAHSLSARGFWRQHFNYGTGAYRYRDLRADRGKERIRVEPLAFYAGLLRYPFSFGRGWRATVSAGLVAVSQVANAAGFLCERFRQAGGRAMPSETV